MCESCELVRRDREACEHSAAQIEAAERDFWDRVPQWDEGISATDALGKLIESLTDYARTRQLPDVADDIRIMITEAFNHGLGK